MSQHVIKCEVCRARLDEEDLFCVNCGTESPVITAEDSERSQTMQATHNFTCDGCGASMSYDATAGDLLCPFCGSSRLSAESDAKVLAPDLIVPFVVTRDQALGSLRAWMGKGFWRPGDLAQAATVTKLLPVYLPYWVFSAQTHSFWTADSSQTPPGARASWYPLSGEHSGRYEGVLVGASGALTPAETFALLPFDLTAAQEAARFDLENAIYEPFRVQRKYARPQAIEGFERLVRNACRNYVPGSARKLQVNTRLEELTGRPILVPVYIMAYQYQGSVFRFLMNGQTGRHVGDAPTSYVKAFAAAGIAIGAVLFFMLLAAICAGIAGSR